MPPAPVKNLWTDELSAHSAADQGHDLNGVLVLPHADDPPPSLLR